MSLYKVFRGEHRLRQRSPQKKFYHKENYIMTVKEIVIEKIKELPDDVTWDEIEERILFVSGILKAVKSMDNGQGVPKEQVKEKIKKWVSK